MKLLKLTKNFIFYFVLHEHDMLKFLLTYLFLFHILVPGHMIVGSCSCRTGSAFMFLLPIYDILVHIDVIFHSVHIYFAGPVLVSFHTHVHGFRFFLHS